jgi:hypothetical protein
MVKAARHNPIVRRRNKAFSLIAFDFSPLCPMLAAK